MWVAARADWIGRVVYGSDRTIKPTSAWYQVFRHDRGADEKVYVSVETVGGAVYTGSVVSYSVDPGDPAERELVLGPPLELRRDDQQDDLEGWQRVVLPGSQVASIVAAYAPKSVTN